MAGTTVAAAGEYLDELAGMTRKLDRGAIERYAGILFGAWKAGHRVLVFGNGGSAYNASHHVTDYVKTASVAGRSRLKALSMGDNVGMLTAVGNDLSYEEAFSYPLESYGEAGDVAVAISCSGNSPNILRACRWAKEHGLTVVALTGFDGGAVKALADVHINVPSRNYGVIEDLHMSIGHIAAQLLQRKVVQEGTR
jgi:D-sedoheptulose 7-phosphate isomerase